MKTPMRTMGLLLLAGVSAVGVGRAAESRPVMARSWTLATDDTRLTLGVTAEGRLTVSELICPAAGWNWIAAPALVDLPTHVEVAGARKAVEWRLADAKMDDQHGRRLSLRLVHDDPALEITSVWHARKGPGPIHHSVEIKNTSAKPVTIGEQATFDVNLTGAATMWSFHSDCARPSTFGPHGGRALGAKIHSSEIGRTTK